MKYLVVIEKGPRSYGAFVPDLPGCVAVARSAREVKRLIQEAIDRHLLDLRERGLRTPRPKAAPLFVAAPRTRDRAA
jgi:predicted RNase H-like HicB family nuclease